MAAIKLPLSGDVFQTFTINLGESSDPATERDAILIASYGKQLGRIGEALIVLLKHVPLAGLPPEDKKAIVDLKCMLTELANLKKKRGKADTIFPPLC